MDYFRSLIVLRKRVRVKRHNKGIKTEKKKKNSKKKMLRKKNEKALRKSQIKCVVVIE
ncbi:hypothetical protein HanIR_Chr10g0481211 [Helianthus annuus]|nr:hypothetical protein HanIR_Chr10g0481211 [Helianthus annuus]